MSKYEIQGMTCEGCVSSVTAALRQALPGHEVEVALESGQVRIEGEHDPEAVARAIEDAGFDFVGPVD